jgi:hypothetical protein
MPGRSRRISRDHPKPAAADIERPSGFRQQIHVYGVV